ncbi:MAG TPA: oligosaccharide flippase family protein [Halococcus sp.]|nr:oligosaccharide flippase family protein [Halococcus sp.]
MRLGQTSAITFVSQLAVSIAGFAATVYIFRYLGETVYGTYALFMAVLVWLKIIGNNGVRMALIKRLSESGTAGEYLSASALLQVIVFVVLTVIIVLFRDFINSYLGFAASLPLIGILAVTFFYGTVTGTLEGEHRVHIASMLQPVDRTLRSALQIAAAALGFGLLGLLWGYAVAAVLVGFVGITFITVRPSLPEREHITRLTDFAGYSWLTGIESQAFSSMDTIILGFFVASGLIGVYEVAWNLASVLAVFGLAVSQSLFPQLSSLSSRDDFRSVTSLTNDALAYSGLFVIPGLVGALVLGKSVLAIYGQEATMGYVVLVVLVAARLVYVYESQLITVLNAIDRPDAAFRVSVAFIVTNLALNVVLVSEFGWFGAAVATAISALLGLVLAYRALSVLVSVTVPIAEIGKQWTAAAVMGAFIYAGRLWLGVGVVTAFVLVPVGGAVYFAVLSVLSARFRSVVQNNLPAVDFS